MAVIDLLKQLGNNEIILGISTACSIVGFCLTIIVTIRTTRISSILKHNQLTNQYNKERTAFQKTFEGHRVSIIEDGIKTDKILNDMLKNVEAYCIKFEKLLPLRERIRLYRFKLLLKKEQDKTNWKKICIDLAIISGHLDKKEEKHNG